MRLALLLILTAAAGPAVAADEEDAAHRADRLRTAQLNRSVAARRPVGRGSDRSARDAYQRDLDAYDRAMADWRERVAACRAGDWDACR